MSRDMSARRLAYRLAELYYLPTQGDRFKHKTQCPACMSVNPSWKAKCFTPFVHVSTGQILDPHVGFCDYASCPLNACNSPLTPFRYFLENSLDAERFKSMIDDFKLPPVQRPTRTPYRIPWEGVKPTLSLNSACLNINTLFLGLLSLFTRRYTDIPSNIVWNVVAQELFGTYLVGTYQDNGEYSALNNSVIFWEIDDKFDVREGKLMQFDPSDAHRVKKEGAINWAGNMGFGGVQKINLDKQFREHCLFGLHLLATNIEHSRKVYLVESQKTAIAMRINAILSNLRSTYYVQAGVMKRKKNEVDFVPPIFLATGGCAMLNSSVLDPLRGYEVVCYPDSGGATEHWRKAVEGMENITVNDYMERLRLSGLCGDNADLLDVFERYGSQPVLNVC